MKLSSLNQINNRYLGIDLGTTNSCVAWGLVDGVSGRINPEIIPIRMAGVPTAQELVPSVVMYRRNQTFPTTIGVSAKQQLLHGTMDTENVIIRSVKLQMGNTNVTEAPWLTPQQVSAHVLALLKESAERKYGTKQTDVVIGVPACFDVDKWRATEQAAYLADFTRVHLIDEPKAALLDFINAQEHRAPQHRVVDFSRPRTICVFDPGGGTLDVSIVRVQQIPVQRGGKTLYEIKYDDLGLTRQPFLGGDDFDNLLANFLKMKFEFRTGIHLDTIPDIASQSRIHGTLLEYAEDAKKNLSDQIHDFMTFQKMSLNEAMEEAVANILVSFLYKSYPLDYRLTYREYAEIVAPLMGWSLQFSDLERPDIQRKLAYQERMQKSENVIFPIYDALLKARNKLGTTPNVDIILVSGGMSKLPIIQSRLEDFFGPNKPIIEVPSPDLSVAKGASLHHYNLINDLDRTSSLLPEAICLEVDGTFVPLVSSNTPYPTVKPIVPKGFQLAIPNSRIPYIDVPLWRGQPPHPTAKLIDRRIDLSDKSHYLQQGDIVDLQITIDANRHLRFEAWLQRNPSIRFDVSTVMP